MRAGALLKTHTSHNKRFPRLLVVFLVLLVGGCGGGLSTADDGGLDEESDAANPSLEWSTILPLTLTVGVAVDLNLAAYLNNPYGSASITIDQLPDGLTLEAGIISGTPSVASTNNYVTTATATDNEGIEKTATSEPFEIRVVMSSVLLSFEQATPEQIGLYLPLTVVVPDDAMVTLRYRALGDLDWKSGHPLLRIHPEWSSAAPVALVDSFAGTIFDLNPGVSYRIELTLQGTQFDPQVIETVYSTRSLPRPHQGVTTTATTADDLQAMLDGLVPGDVLQLSNGTYDVEGLTLRVSGTEASPITIRGETRDSVVLHDNSGRVLQILEASHLIIEDLTIRGSEVDSGTNASSEAISLWNGASQAYITFRRLKLVGVDKGIVASKAVTSILLYDSILEGNNAWNAAFVESNLTWNDDGVRLPGEGNCAFQNTLHGFGDSFAVIDGVHSAAIYYYRNRISMTGDDAFEGDYGTRNIAFYDNHISNSGTLLSLDPLWGGPLYCFRNISVNTVRGPFKFNSRQSGFVVYNNTIVRTEGTTTWGWVQFNNGDLKNWSYRNNILIYQGGTGKLLALESGGMTPLDFTHNGWFPDEAIWWSSTGGSHDSLATARDALPATAPLFGVSTQRHEHDLIVQPEPFETELPLGADHLTEVTSLFVPTLKAESKPRHAGTAIPNITDGFSGVAPDMGALVEGRAIPAWGAP